MSDISVSVVMAGALLVLFQYGDRPPPLYICSDCAVSLRQDHASFLTDILRPIEKVAVLCENKVTTTSCSIQLRLGITSVFALITFSNVLITHYQHGWDVW